LADRDDRGAGADERQAAGDGDAGQIATPSPQHHQAPRHTAQREGDAAEQRGVKRPVQEVGEDHAFSEDVAANRRRAGSRASPG
jgi:hypothetical protein